MKPNIAARIGHWSATNRKKAIWGWIAFVLIAVLIGGAVGTNNLKPEDQGSGESQVASRAIADAGFDDNSQEQVLVQLRTARGDPQALQAAVEDVVARLDDVPLVQRLQSPYEEGHEGQLAADGRSALVTFEITGDHNDVEPVLAATAAAQKAHPDLRVEQFGDASAGKALTDVLSDDFKRAETISLPITLIILLLAFGALVAAGLPLLLGLTAVGATLGLLGPISQLLPTTEESASIILLIGLAVGVDYSMFYLRRVMEERDAGRDAQAAVVAAAATSGHAVLVSGATVMIAMAGMFIAGNASFISYAVATIVVVAVAVLGSLTFLPAMLAWLAKRGWIEKGRVPWLGKRRHERNGESRLWGAILDRVLARPAVYGGLAAALLIALAIPALSLKTVTPGVQGIPRDLPVMQTYDRIQAAFPGGPLPALVTIQADDVTAAPVTEAVRELNRRALATGYFAEPVTQRVSDDGTLAVVQIPLRGSGTDSMSKEGLTALREDLIPSTLDRVTGVDTNVAGITAASEDRNAILAERLPWVFAFVLGFAFLLLLFTFKSIVVPIKAIVLNMLSVAASYGVLKLVFQDGRGEGLLDFDSVGGITAWLPMFLFVVLFGLSMDYHVFILSRIREAVDQGMSTDDAVAHGIRSTAGVVTSAAVVMVAVFGVFATLSILDFKQMGIGLAVAILIDATIVRAVLLPATMKLLGERNWYMPKRLARFGPLRAQESTL